MKLGVVGSRTFNDYDLLKRYLDLIHNREKISFIVSGGAKGADKLSERWALENNVETIIFIPDWEKYKKAAGFIRNKDIITESDKVIAFWDNISKGTLSSINLSKEQNKKIIVVKF